MNRSGLVGLVIDDEVQIRRFLRAGFELEGFTVQEAATGAEGIRAATLKSVDLVIVDLELPDIDGAEIVERLRAWSTVPTISTTASRAQCPGGSAARWQVRS